MTLELHYSDLKKHDLYITNFENFVKYQKGKDYNSFIQEIGNSFSDYIHSKPKESKELKEKVNNYFHILIA